jgi:glyoxylase-like metal-dependent hydrolase (beta-lactamase superfamily II)
MYIVFMMLMISNLGYLIIDEANQHVLAVDPAEEGSFLPVLRGELAAGDRRLLAVLTTHGHTY